MEAKKRRGVNIPHEIVEEILVKVPVKSLVRFKGVSKEWIETIEWKMFVDKHTKSPGEGQARIVTVVSFFDRETTLNKRINLLENLVFMPSNGIVVTSPYRLIRNLCFRPNGFKIFEPCDGLFCIYTAGHGEFCLVNPATTSRRILPVLDPSYKVIFPWTLVGMVTSFKVSRTWRNDRPTGVGPWTRVRTWDPLVGAVGALHLI